MWSSQGKQVLLSSPNSSWATQGFRVAQSGYQFSVIWRGRKRKSLGIKDSCVWATVSDDIHGFLTWALSSGEWVREWDPCQAEAFFDTFLILPLWEERCCRDTEDHRAPSYLPLKFWDAVDQSLILPLLERERTRVWVWITVTHCLLLFGWYSHFIKQCFLAQVWAYLNNLSSKEILESNHKWNNQ